MTAVEVQRTGPRTTVQDLGRPGYAHLGVSRAGAADPGSLRRANALVGNSDDAAALESTLGGLAVIAIGTVSLASVGAPITVDGVEHEAPVTVDDGASVRVATPSAGVYSYLAVAGGFDLPAVLGSRSTDTLSGLGPTVLAAGDVLPIGGQSGDGQSGDGQRATNELRTADGPLHIVLGPRDDWFTDDAVRQLLATEWTVQPDSDRTGLRLAGPPLEQRTNDELPSEGMIAGAIQVPPDGQPIVFLANHPTTGGYPVMAVIRSDDVGRAAQTRPGQRLRFQL
jgi:biotin-dependent carboxylase-like uncharacterized protein